MVFSRRNGIFSGAEPANQRLLLYTPSSTNWRQKEMEIIFEHMVLNETYELTIIATCQINR